MENEKWMKGIKVVDIEINKFILKHILHVQINEAPKPNPHVQVYQKPVAANHHIRPTPG